MSTFSPIPSAIGPATPRTEAQGKGGTPHQRQRGRLRFAVHGRASIPASPRLSGRPRTRDLGGLESPSRAIRSVSRIGAVIARVPMHLMAQPDDALRLHLQL